MARRYYARAIVASGSTYYLPDDGSLFLAMTPTFCALFDTREAAESAVAEYEARAKREGVSCPEFEICQTRKDAL